MTEHEIDPGEGYRLLEPDETIQAGDMYSWNGNVWKTTHHIGDQAGSFLAHTRRAVRLDPSDSRYRLLDVGELFHEGDNVNGGPVTLQSDSFLLGQPCNHPTAWRRRIEATPAEQEMVAITEYWDARHNTPVLVRVEPAKPMTRLERVAAGLEEDPYFVCHFSRGRAGGRLVWYTDEFIAAAKAETERILKKDALTLQMDDMTGEDL